MSLTVAPVTPRRWDDLKTLFGPNGAYSNCWCTWFLLTGRAWDDARGEGRRELLATLVADGAEPGILAYDGDTPIGWCAVGPRDRYDRLTSPRARVYRTVDDQPTWVVSCFFIHRDHRRRGVAKRLLDAAVSHAAASGATIVEGYPIDDGARDARAADLFVGTLAMFQAAGFDEVARHQGRPLVRKHLT